MPDENINQTVNVGDQATAGSITVVGKQEVRPRSRLQEALDTFLMQNVGYFILAAIVEVALASLYLPFKNLYIIPLWLWGLTAIVLAGAVWGWYAWGWRKLSRWNLSAALLLTPVFSGILGWQAWQITFPTRFAPNDFGIVVAELGEGADFQRTAKAREISGQVFEHLCAALRSERIDQINTDPCDGTSDQAAPRRVILKKIGVISNTSTAEAYGSRVGAAIVIWGQLLTSDQGGATIRFQVRETLDRASNPEYPLVLPVTITSPEIFARELDLESNPVQLKAVVAQQSTIISAFALGLAAYLDRDLSKAVTQFQLAAQTVEANPSQGISSAGKSLLYFYLGNATMAQGHIEAGQAWLRRAIAVSPDEPALPLSLALGYASLSQEQERVASLQAALGLIQKWLETHPEHNAATYDRGIVYQLQRQFDFAAAAFEEVISRDPHYYVAYINLGQVNAKRGRFEEAEDALKNAITVAEETGANASWAHLNLAIIYEQSEKPALARAEFLAAIERDPKVDWMYYYYARFLEQQGEMDAALRMYQKMTEVTRNKAWGYATTANFLKSRGLLQAALEYYQQAVQLAPDNSLVQAYLAETYFKLGDTERALRSYEAAITRNASYYEYYSYAQALFATGDYALAARMYEHSLLLRPLDWGALLNLGQTYQALGQPEQAKATYLKILTLAEHFPEQALRTARDRLSALGVAAP
jgi:tetratricopeptide (TPR) repeat protein